MVDHNEIAEKWQKKWDEDKIFEANPDKRKKFFLTFPYPYIQAYQHIGHLFTLLRVEVFARYKRLKGYNVLFPQGWHVTGSPIVQSAKRVKDREPKQMKMMEDMGFSEDDIKKFEDPKYWIEFFAPEFKKDYQRMGMSVDWRREFITSDLNPRYDKFIRWQFRKLKEKDYVIKGKFPVVWDPKEKVPVGDHDRIEGEGETPQEFLLVKHKMENGKFLVSATLRPDTILGITNLYVHPETEYVIADVGLESGKETWIVGKKAVERMKYQDFDITEKDTILGNDLVGEWTSEFGDRKVPVLPATFLDPEVGTGLVHSVPSDSADDLIALRDLQSNDDIIRKYGLDVEKIKSIEPIPILNTPEHGNIAAQSLLDKYGVKSQNEKGKLEKIRKELYKISHYTAEFNEKYKDVFKKDIVGMKVHEGKDIVQEELIEQGWAMPYYELTGKVIARSLAECVVKIVDDQWFVDYGNEKWKEDTKKCLEQLKLYPEKARTQFEYVIDWLHEWACTREEGIGTRLPWDEKWLIESLSDSTIYMAYYTLLPILNDIPEDQIDDNLFDYVLLNKDTKTKCDKKIADRMRESFNYWYPVDFRNSGKDLIQNHLTFFLFNHVAIFPEDKWPAGIGVNGWVTIDGQKMSKSLGNVIPVREVAREYGPDSARMTMLSGGESMDDPNWDSRLAESLPQKLEQMMELFISHHGKGRDEINTVDKWALSKLHRTIKEATEAMEKTLFRTALQKIFFDLNKTVKEYLKKTTEPNKDVMTSLIETETIMLSPYAPHICEEIWSQLGKGSYCSLAEWPVHDESLIDVEAEAAEETYENTKADIRNVMNLTGINEPEKIKIYTAPGWKYEFIAKLQELMKTTRNPGEILKAIMNTKLKQYGQDISKLVPSLIKDPSKMPEILVEKEKELESLASRKESLEDEFGAEVLVLDSEKADEPKARKAMPGKPAILLE